MTTSDTSGQVLTDTCSILQHGVDQNGACGTIQRTITGVRWSPAQDHPIEFIDLVGRLPDGEFRIIRMTAQDLGPHVHQYEDEDGYCQICGWTDPDYNDQADQDEQDANGNPLDNIDWDSLEEHVASWAASHPTPDAPLLLIPSMGRTLSARQIAIGFVDPYHQAEIAHMLIGGSARLYSISIILDRLNNLTQATRG